MKNTYNERSRNIKEQTLKNNFKKYFPNSSLETNSDVWNKNSEWKIWGEGGD